MSRRKTGGAVGRHAGERLLSTLGGGLEDPLEPGMQAGSAFAYPPPAQSRAMAPPRPPTTVFRFRTGLRAALLIAALCFLATGGFWWQALASRTEVAAHDAAQPEAEVQKPGGPAVTPTVPAIAGAQPLSEETAGALPVAVVHVAGAVNSPGVVTLPSGSRVNDAIAAAGGPSAGSDPGQLNLAAVVTDGQKVHVPRPGEEPPAQTAGTPPAPGGSTAARSGPAEGGPVNLNTATPAELATLPRVGPVLAQRIIDWRLEHGPFATVQELDAVDGVGPKMVETLLPLVTL